VCNIGLRCDVWLQDVLHVIIHSVHIVYVARGVAATVFGEVAGFPTVEAGSFGLRMAVVLLCWGARCVAVCFILWLCGVNICIVALVLASIVGCSGAG
jgi:hypothetical protein